MISRDCTFAFERLQSRSLRNFTPTRAHHGRLDWMDRYASGHGMRRVDHTSVGTDQQMSPGAMQDYANYANLADAMLKGGFSPTAQAINLAFRPDIV